MVEGFASMACRWVGLEDGAPSTTSPRRSQEPSFARSLLDSGRRPQSPPDGARRVAEACGVLKTAGRGRAVVQIFDANFACKGSLQWLGQVVMGI